MNSNTKQYIQTIKSHIETKFPSLLSYDVSHKLLDIVLSKSEWSEIIEQPFLELSERGGKRIRPLLANLTYNVLGGQDDIASYTLIPEILHMGTLMIDDIQDNSDLRRGKPSLHTMYGIPMTINTANAYYFLSQSYIKNSSLSDSVKREIYESINDEMLLAHIGQGMDISWSNDKSYDISLDKYLYMCECKTGALLRLAVTLGAVLGGATTYQKKVLKDVVTTIGICFQVRDDLLNIDPNNNLGKAGYGEDITAGKMTYVVIEALNKLENEERSKLIDILQLGTKSQSDIDQAIGLIDSSGALTAAKEYVTTHITSALHQLRSILLDGEYMDIYLDIVREVGITK